MATLTKASYEWARRKPDEKYETVEACHAVAKADKDSSKVAYAALDSLRVEANEGDLMLMPRKSNIPAYFTAQSFYMLCLQLEAPAKFLQEHLPATLAAQVLNHQLAKQKNDSLSQLYFHNGDKMKLFGINTEKYTRIYDADILQHLINLKQTNGWHEAPAAFDNSRGIYRSYGDMFCFMVDNERRIFGKDPNGGLSRGFFVWNSEIGWRSFGLQTLNYEWVCGNHRVWGAKNIVEVKVRHIGTADERYFNAVQVELKKYADSSSEETELQVAEAKKFVIAKEKKDVIEAIFSRHIAGLNRKLITDGYDRADAHVDWYGAPNTVWGICGGLTEIARDEANGEQRYNIERASSKVMAMAIGERAAKDQVIEITV